MLGRSAGSPAAVLRRARQRRCSAMPPSMQASLEPVVEVPTGRVVGSASIAAGAFQSSPMMFTQRRSISAVCGYSSLSIMFLS